MEELKQSVIPWSYSYKPPDSNITYNVVSTCAIDTNLQMIYFLWFRGFVPHSVMEKDSLLIKTLNLIKNQNYDKARHELLISDRSFTRKISRREGNQEYWDCTGVFLDNRPFPELFRSSGPVQTIWGKCSKMDDKCPLHTFFQTRSKPLRDASRKLFHFNFSPQQTIQERIREYYGVDVKKCTRSNEISSKEIILDGDDPVGKELSCPENGIRYKSREIAHSSCPWVMTIYGHFNKSTINTLRDIPNTLLVPPETRYSLASVILFDGGHFRGISLDQKIRMGITSSLTDLKVLIKGFKLSVWMIQFQNIQMDMIYWNCGMSRLIVPLMHQELHLL